MPLGWVAGAAALVTAGTGAYNAYEQSGITGQASSQSATQFGEQQGYEQMLNNLISNPSSVTSLPQYAFNFQQGSDAVAREMGASGFLGSGNEATALTQYGQGYAMNTLTQQEQLLTSLSGLGAPSSNSSLLGVGSSSNQAQFNQTGQLLASLGYMNGANNPWGSGITSQDLSTASSPGFGQAGTMPAGGGYNFSFGGIQ